MRRTGTGRRALVAILVIATTGGASACASSWPREQGLLWHPSRRFAVPDLARDGWQRARVEEADLAFRRRGEGLIAVRSDCGAEAAPGARTRALWHAARDEGLRPKEARRLEVAGWPALETRAGAGDAQVRTVVVRAKDCALDLIHVAPAHAPSEAFDRFLAGVRPGEAP